MRNRVLCSLAVMLLFVLASLAPAQPPPVVVTKVTVTELCCKGCVKKITTRLTQVPGVAGVQGDLPSATLSITHRQGMSPSPRAVWEAVEKADHTPTRLEGPAGTFTARPPS